MYEYHLKNAVFSPNRKNKLIVAGEVKPLSALQSKLLLYFINNPHVVKTNNEILDDVWGPGVHTHKALTAALGKLKKQLPADAQIENVHGKGYVFRHDVVRTEFRFKAIEQRLRHSLPLQAAIIMLVIMTTTVVAHAGHGLYRYIHPVLQYVIDEFKPLFARDRIVGTSQLSPDTRFVAHRSSSKMFEQDKLALHDLNRGESRPLVKLHFLAGFKWNIKGDRLVYQNMLDGQCQVRLITFYNEDKTDYSDELLTECFKTSGNLSFAWFNDKAFFVNFTGKEEITTPNGLPQHHLYSFNIETKKRQPLEKATYQGAIGFFSLEYDPSTDTLYFLQFTKDFKTILFKYKNNTLTKLKTFDYQLRYFTVADDKLIYKNQQQQFVINHPADDFANQQILLKPRMASLNKPHLLNDKFVYLAGDDFGVTLQHWQAGQLNSIDLDNYKPTVLARYNNQLVFSAKQSGSYQLYVLNQQQQIKRISDITNKQYIHHISVAGDLFALSYFNKVEIYAFDKVLQLRHSFPNHSRGIINADGSKILLTSADQAGNKLLVEQSLTSINAKGKAIAAARFSFYHNDDIIQLNNDNELIRLQGDSQYLIASNVNVNLLETTTLQGDHFVYAQTQAGVHSLHFIDLYSGAKQTTVLTGAAPSYLQAVGNSLFISTPVPLKPTLMIGTLTTK